MPKAAGGMAEAVQYLKQLLEEDFNKKMKAMKAGFQLEFIKLKDYIAAEVTRTTSQIA